LAVAIKPASSPAVIASGATGKAVTPRRPPAPSTPAIAASASPPRRVSSIAAIIATAIAN
jgi:hypothetical protein